MDELSIGIPDNWKEQLIDSIISGIVGSPNEKVAAYMNTGYAYKFYAPASIYKYIPPNKKKIRSHKKQ